MLVKRRDGAILRQLHALYNIGAIGDLTDGQLLERFATDTNEGAELALSALVERHEAMVWRVCLAIVRDEHLAEDAVQATFLVLVRKARSLWVRDSLGPWLHQVACRTSSCLRTNIIRRRKHERRRAEKAGAGLVELAAERYPDRDAAIHEEVNRLPEKFRAPVVLCDLEGRTHQEAARFLGWPIGTVKSRQSQGRGLIRDRLARRGVGLAVAGAVAESLTQTAVAAIPKQVSQCTVNAAMHLSGRVLTSSRPTASVLTLTHGVIRAMLWTRMRYLAVAALAVGIASGEAIFYVRGEQAPAPEGGHPISQRPTTTSQTPKLKNSEKAAEQPTTEAPQASLRAQHLATRRAKVVYEIAKSTRELAEIALEEYRTINRPRELAPVDGEIKLARAELTRAQDRFESEKNSPSLELRSASKRAVKSTQFTLEMAESKRKVLVDYTQDLKIKQLQSEVEKAGSDELAKQASWELQQAIENKMARELGLKAN